MHGTDRGRIRAGDGGAECTRSASGEPEPSRALQAFALLRIRLDLPDEIQSVPLCCEILGSVLRALKVDDARADEIEESVCEAASDIMDLAGNPGSGYHAAAEFFMDRVWVQILERGGVTLFGAEYRFPRPIAVQADLSALSMSEAPTGGSCPPEPPRRPVTGVRSR